MRLDPDRLLVMARKSLSAAEVLHRGGHHGFAASRAYYAMFYVAEALLARRGMEFTKHGAVHSAFGQHFAKADPAFRKFHRYLIRGMQVRHVADYGDVDDVPEEEATEQIARAREFIALGEQMLGSIADTDEGSM